MSKLLVDVGSTYIKLSSEKSIEQKFRDFNKSIYDDLNSKFGVTLKNYEKEEAHQ